jgi:hypothetical protein
MLFAQSSAAMCDATVASFQDQFPPCNLIPFNDSEVMEAFFEEHNMAAMKGLMLQLLNSDVTGANNYLKLLMTEELIAATTWTEPKKDKDKLELGPKFKFFFQEFLFLAEEELPMNAADHINKLMNLHHLSVVNLRNREKRKEKNV